MKNVPQPAPAAGLTESTDGYLTKQGVADHLHVSTRTIDQLMRSKKISYIKLTRKLVRFKKAEVDEYLARNFRINARGEERCNP